MKNIATTIMQQLGGNAFSAMTGARNFTYDSKTGELTFRLPSRFAKDGINCVQIRLDPSDTYTVKFLKIRGMNVATVKELDMVYADDLRTVFAKVTGLAVTL